jgi:hypothetical protein
LIQRNSQIIHIFSIFGYAVAFTPGYPVRVYFHRRAAACVYLPAFD